MWNFQYKNNNSYCFPIAIINFCKKMNIVHPKLRELVNSCVCRYGGTYADKEIKTIERFELPLIQTINHEDVFRKGGILCIKHPIFNFHATACFTDEIGYTLINSMIGPIELNGLSKETIENFIPKRGDFRHYFYQSSKESASE